MTNPLNLGRIGVQGKEQGDEGCRGFEENPGPQRKLWGERKKLRVKVQQ